MARFSDERTRAAIQGTTRFRVLTFPLASGEDSDLTIAVRCLSEAEIDGCRVEAQRRIRDVAKLRGWSVQDMTDIDPDLLQRFVERSVVARAFFDPATTHTKDPVPFFASESEVEQLSSVQSTLLLRAYLEHQEWLAPLRTMSEAEAKEFAATLGKAPDPSGLLNLYEHDSLMRLCISMASALRAT
ncbi:MAG: hypothetical protein R3B99_13540 [Polyangiales bacterium]|nr:hypothetical protein [Myxococcales bacterium]MCB9601291.1 hypothetical protein [Sandaracinus sp.]